MTERDVERLNSGRLLRDAGQVLLPILASMKVGVQGRMIAHFRAGELTMLTALTAELAVITELETKITQNNHATAKREGNLHGS